MRIPHTGTPPRVGSDVATGGALPLPSSRHRILRGRLVSPLLALVLGAVVLGLGGGAAFGLWNRGGAGAGGGGTGSLAPITVVAFTGGDSPAISLLPGGSSQVIVRVNNTNSFPVTLTVLTLNGAITANGGVGACTTTGVTVSFPTAPSVTVSPGSQLLRFTGAASMSLSAQNGCQGATFNIPVSATFQK